MSAFAPPPDEPRPPLRAWVGGRLVPVEHARVSVFERGLRTGEGVFETMRAYGDHVLRLDDHLRRAAAGAAELGFSLGDAHEVAAAVRATARANLAALDGADSAVRLTVSAGPIDPWSPSPGRAAGGPTVIVTSHPLGPPPASATAVTLPMTRELPHVKALSYVVAITARRRAAAAGADEALLVRGDDVLEGATSNVFALVDGVLVTPPVESGLLAGVTRAIVLELADELGLEHRLRPLGIDELCSAQEAFLTSTSRQLLPLRAVDDHPLPTPADGVTARLRAAFQRLVDRERAAAAD